ncbi:YrzE family protein [Pararhodonellum marinum]|uniref:YrzE family protein n=1 Tax=Pararhodonellum marinum TaxID=2755358 RepID=UPI00188DCDD5|nr:YrzE family protein [Pararhodonellum marinum]
METTSNLNSYHKVPPKGISWRAILGGTVAALSIMLILNLIGLAIGLWSIEPTEETNPLSGLGTGSIIWWVLSNLIVLFIGGFVAARVGVSFASFSGVVHGVMTWALYSLVSAWLLTSVIGSIISGVGNLVGGVLSATGQVVENQLGPVVKEQFENLELSLDDARDEFYSLLEDTDKDELDPDYLESQAQRSASDAQEAAQSPGSRDAKVEGVLSQSKNRFEQSFEALDKQALVNILVERTDMSENEAKQTVENTFGEFERAREEFEEFLQEAEETARAQAEKIAEAAGDAAMYLAIALILGGIAAALGGYVGVKNLREDYFRNEHLVEEREAAYVRGEVIK